MELITIWSGSDRNVYLCVPDPTPPVLRYRPCTMPPKQRRECRDAVRAQLMALFNEQPVWTVKDLRMRVPVDPAVFNGVIQRARDKGLIRSVGYGRIALVRRKKVA